MISKLYAILISSGINCHVFFNSSQSASGNVVLSVHPSSRSRHPVENTYHDVFLVKPVAKCLRTDMLATLILVETSIRDKLHYKFVINSLVNSSVYLNNRISFFMLQVSTRVIWNILSAQKAVLPIHDSTQGKDLSVIIVSNWILSIFFHSFVNETINLLPSKRNANELLSRLSY